jgi:DNA-directed RNA polymerase subunit RPC12/RpoP
MIRCPQCKKTYTDNIKKDLIQETITCPYCGYEVIGKLFQKSNRTRLNKLSKTFDECSWEEPSEGRKTILNIGRPRSYKPLIASLLLFVVVLIGFSSAIYPEIYLQTPLNTLFSAGFTGSIIMTLQNESGIPQKNLYVWIDSLPKNMTNSKGMIIINKIPLGKQQVYVSSTLNDSTDWISGFFLPIQSLRTVTVTNQSGTLQIISMPTNLMWCSGIILLLSVLCLLGFISAWKRQYYDVSIFGSIMGISIIGFYFIGTIFSLIALVLLALSKEEFEDGKKGKSF